VSGTKYPCCRYSQIVGISISRNQMSRSIPRNTSNLIGRLESRPHTRREHATNNSPQPTSLSCDRPCIGPRLFLLSSSLLSPVLLIHTTTMRRCFFPSRRRRRRAGGGGGPFPRGSGDDDEAASSPILDHNDVSRISQRLSQLSQRHLILS
jgi:hypothetical protein